MCIQISEGILKSNTTACYRQSKLVMALLAKAADRVILSRPFLVQFYMMIAEVCFHYNCCTANNYYFWLDNLTIFFDWCACIEKSCKYLTNKWTVYVGLIGCLKTLSKKNSVFPQTDQYIDLWGAVTNGLTNS